MRRTLALLLFALSSTVAHAGIRIDNPKLSEVRELGSASSDTSAAHARTSNPGMISLSWSLPWLSLSVSVSALDLTVELGSPWDAPSKRPSSTP